MFGEYFRVMFLRFFLNLLFGEVCLVCGEQGNFVCDKCFSALSINDFQSCPFCGKKNDDGRFCSKFCSSKFHFDQLIVTMSYDQNAFLRKTISSYKYGFHKNLSEVLAIPLRNQLLNLQEKICNEETLFFTFVPLHRKKLRQRGFNQAFLLAKKLRQKPFIDCLERKIYRPDQASLNQKDRMKNLIGSIEVKSKFLKPLKNKTVVVIDDVATTGSTLNECARALKESGVKICLRSCAG
jgi:competence protein ComFC